MQHLTLKSYIWLFAILLCVSVPLWADGPGTGTIDGRVIDAQGGALPGATVIFSGTAGRENRA